jgi:hypothetical protein
MELTTQNRQLMAEHDDLKFLRVSRSEQKRAKLQAPLQDSADDRQEHGFSSTTERPPFYTDRFNAPHRLTEEAPAAVGGMPAVWPR